MALFKISKGLASNLQKNKPYAKEGNIYYTTDESKFYIDVSGDGTTTSAVIGTNRIPLNAETTSQVDIAALNAVQGTSYPVLVGDGKYVKSSNLNILNGTLVIPSVSSADEVLIVNSGAGRGIVIENNVSNNFAMQITKGKGIKVAQDPTDSMELTTKNYVDTNFSKGDHTHDYLKYKADTRSVATAPDDYNQKLTFVGIKLNSAIGDVPSPGSPNGFSYVVGLRGYTNQNAGKAHELAFNDSGIYHRAGSTTDWDGWNQIVLNSNTIDISTTGKITATGGFVGNASSATEFKDAKSITLTGDVSGTASSKAGWSIATTLTNSGVTAGTYGQTANATPGSSGTFLVPKVVVDSKGRITSASNSVITLPPVPTLDSLGLSQAMRLIGVATVAIVDGTATNPQITGYNFSNVKAGDVIIDKESNYEYVWTLANKWERLGPDGSYSLSGHVHTLTHQPKGEISEISITPAGTITSTFSGTIGSHGHTFTGREATLAHTFAGTAASHGHTFSGGTETLKHEFTGDKATLEHTFTGTAGTATASYTPAGSVTSSFTGTKANTLGPSGTTADSATITVAASGHTHSVTAAGTISAPKFTGTAVTSAASNTNSTIQQITGVGTLPTLTKSCASKCLTLTFSQGTLPTREGVNVALNTHTHSVTAAGTVAAPVFTGTAVTSTTPSATQAVAASGHIHSYTPAGTITATFKGTTATISSSYTPAGTIADHVYTPTGEIGDHAYTPEGTISSTSITPAGTISAHTFTPAGSIANASTTPVGTVKSTFAGTAFTHDHTFTGISETMTTSAG